MRFCIRITIIKEFFKLILKMPKIHNFVLLALVVMSFSIPAFAQNQQTTGIEKMPVRMLPINNPMTLDKLKQDNVPTPATLELDNFQIDILRRITDIYQIYIAGLEAQINNNFIDAETSINEAINASQTLLDDYPEIRSDRRFTELSRVILSEYRNFYGITESEIEPEGEIFSINEELFSEENFALNESFRFPRDIELNKTDVPLITNNYVTNSLVFYTIRRPEVMELWLERAETYMPVIQQILKEEKVPSELAYLAFIESGLNPTARSWAGAAGMWQFIAATGKVYGLEINWWIDERRDPEKATRAAARHLRDLYNIWGDWHLALANYNISPRGLNRAINRAGGVKDYWVAYPYLPKETRGYVPGFIATALIGLNPEEFGFQKSYNGTPYAYDVAEVEGLMPLDELAKAAGISTDELKRYNPELLRWATPPGDNYPLKLPKGVLSNFLAAYKDIPKEKRAENITMHTVSRGESLGVIARKYGTSVRNIYASNENLGDVIYPGQTLVVPLAMGGMNKISANNPTNITSSSSNRSSTTTTQVTTPANSEKLTYTVKTGDTVGHIAEWYGVRAYQIRTWNGISNTIRVGQKLTVYVPKATKDFYSGIEGMTFAQKQNMLKNGGATKALLTSNTTNTDGYMTYTVQPNDNLDKISKMFGVTISAIRNLNNLNGNTIYPNQTLKISKAN